jgi:hypothetical protein
MKSKKSDVPKPPKHLSAEMKRFWLSRMSDYVLEPHHQNLLQQYCETWDAKEKARKAKDANPDDRNAVKDFKEYQVICTRLLRELALDVEPPGEVRPPRIAGTGA